MTETLANGYSSESTRRELSYEYPHDLVLMIFIIICFFVHWTKITSAAKGLSHSSLEIFLTNVVWTLDTFEYIIGMNYKFLKYLKDNCVLDFDKHFFLSNVF